MFLSIIVPVYNVEKYLSQCVDSLMNQIDDDIEVILVDDGSTDSSGELCDLYGKRFSNIRVVHQKNCGLGAARNTGIDMARGTYIWYVDSDDYVSENAINVLKMLLKEELDVLLFLATSFSDGPDVLSPYERSSGLDLVKNGKKYIYECFKNNEYITSVCLRVFRKQFLKDIGLRFGREKLHEDEQYSFLSLYFAKKVMATDYHLYMRRYRLGSKTIEAMKETETNFRRMCDGYGSAIFRLLDVYELLPEADTGKKLLIIQTGYYYFLIMSRYLVMDRRIIKRNRNIIRAINERIKYYKKYYPWEAKFVYSFPEIYRLYKIVRRSVSSFIN